MRQLRGFFRIPARIFLALDTIPWYRIWHHGTILELTPDRHARLSESTGRREPKEAFNPVGPGSTVRVGSFSPAGWLSRSDEEPLQCDPSAGFPEENALCLLGVARYQAFEGAEETPRASSDNHGFLLGVGG